MTLYTAHYNLLLRCVVNCGSGHLPTLRDLIQKDVTQSAKKLNSDATQNILPSEESGTSESSTLPELSPLSSDCANEISQTEEVIGEGDVASAADKRLAELVFLESDHTFISADIDSDKVCSSEDGKSPEELKFVSLVAASAIKDVDAKTEGNVYDDIVDILNPKLKLSENLQIKAVNTPTKRLVLLGKQQIF